MIGAINLIQISPFSDTFMSVCGHVCVCMFSSVQFYHICRIIWLPPQTTYRIAPSQGSLLPVLIVIAPPCSHSSAFGSYEFVFHLCNLVISGTLCKILLRLALFTQHNFLDIQPWDYLLSITSSLFLLPKVWIYTICSTIHPMKAIWVLSKSGHEQSCIDFWVNLKFHFFGLNAKEKNHQVRW